MLLLPLLGAAWARDPSCPELYSTQFSSLIDEADTAFASMEMERASAMLLGAEARIPCVIDVIPTPDMARYALRRAWVAALETDQGDVDRWLGLAKALDPSLPWPSYVPNGHPVRDAAAEMAAPPLTAVADKGLSLPTGGGAFLDGRFLTKPEAEPGVPHLLQVGDGSGYLVVSTWQDGLAFPPDVLGPPLAADPTLPEWFGKPMKPGKGPKPAREPRPWTEARSTNLERGLGFGVAAGALWASALMANAAYQERPATGLFVLTDGAVLGAAAAGGVGLVFTGAALFGK